MDKRIIVGISGASGAIYAVRLLEALGQIGIETHLVVSRAGRRTIDEELDLSFDDVRALASVYHPVEDVGASISSGSYPVDGMVVAPCSVRTASEIACGTTMSLLTRAADVMLKERRRLVLMVRETPLHVGHLRTLAQLSEMGAVIAPPVPAFYTRPASLLDMVDHSVGRVLDHLGIDNELAQRWTGGHRHRSPVNIAPIGEVGNRPR
jgi:4-hydroxy-3-polyprenylbenzoate decarboxylase